MIIFRMIIEKKTKFKKIIEEKNLKKLQVHFKTKIVSYKKNNYKWIFLTELLISSLTDVEVVPLNFIPLEKLVSKGNGINNDLHSFINNEAK